MYCNCLLTRFAFFIFDVYIMHDLQTNKYTRQQHKVQNQKNLPGVVKTKNHFKSNSNLKKKQKSKINCNWRFRSRGVELLFDYKIKGWLKRFVDIMYSTTEFKRKVFVLFVKVLLPCNNKWINAFLFIDRAWVSNPNILQEDLSFFKFVVTNWV